MKTKILIFMTCITVLLTACGAKETTEKTATAENEVTEVNYEEIFAWDGDNILGYSPEALDNLDKIVIPKRCSVLTYGTFSGYEGKAKELIFENPDTDVQEIFSYWSNLETVQLPENMQTIPKDFLRDCEALKEIQIPQKVSRIEETAFASCDSLETIQFGSNLKTIDEKAFYGCEALKKVELPDGLTQIGESAFGECTSLTEIYIPSSVEEIDVLAFIQLDNHPITIYVKDGSWADKNFETGYASDGAFQKDYY